MSDYTPEQHLADTTQLERMERERDALPLGGSEGDTERNRASVAIFDLHGKIEAGLHPEPTLAELPALKARITQRQQDEAMLKALQAEQLTTAPGSDAHARVSRDIGELTAALAATEARTEMPWEDTYSTPSMVNWTLGEKHRLTAVTRLMGGRPGENLMLAAGLEDVRGKVDPKLADPLAALPEIELPAGEADAALRVFGRLPADEQARLRGLGAMRSRWFVAGLVEIARREWRERA